VCAGGARNAASCSKEIKENEVARFSEHRPCDLIALSIIVTIHSIQSVISD
jgi:hypothetical protein